MEASTSKVNSCDNCGSRFNSPFELAAHKLRYCKPKSCNKCGAQFRQHRDLLRHEKNRKDVTCTHCDRVFCNITHLNRHLRTIQAAGGGIDNVDLNQRIQPETGYENDDEYKRILSNKAAEINNFEQISPNYKFFNRKIDADFSYEDLQKILLDIFIDQNNAFKINIGFSYILYNAITNEFKYHYNSSNNLLFEHAIIITDRNDVEKLMNKIINLDLATNYYLKRPTSSWVLAGITNVEIFIYEMKDVPIGNPPLDIPDYIKNSKSINALIRHKAKQYNYKDDNCFFRCLALHQGANIYGLERHANRLLQEAVKSIGKKLENGVNISHIPTLEVLFNVAVNIYSLNEDGSADIIYLSRLQAIPMHINLYKNHFSYICNFKTYAKRFECNMCNRIFDQSCHLKRHVEACCTEKEEVYIGGKFKRDETIFERLEKEGYLINEKDRYYPFISVFDYEALQVPHDETIRGRDICYKHVPATFSVCSNISDHSEPVHVTSNGDAQQLKSVSKL